MVAVAAVAVDERKLGQNSRGKVEVVVAGCQFLEVEPEAEEVEAS